jgi:hypothetical protein
LSRVGPGLPGRRQWVASAASVPRTRLPVTGRCLASQLPARESPFAFERRMRFQSLTPGPCFGRRGSALQPIRRHTGSRTRIRIRISSTKLRWRHRPVATCVRLCPALIPPILRCSFASFLGHLSTTPGEGPGFWLESSPVSRSSTLYLAPLGPGFTAIPSNVCFCEQVLASLPIHDRPKTHAEDTAFLARSYRLPLRVRHAAGPYTEI